MKFYFINNLLPLGNVNLRKVNLRPDEINKLLEGLSLPFALKAGMLGNLQLSVSAIIS